MFVISQALSPADHSRDNAGLKYVYPVVSRRAGGVSVGINLNPNNACNWHCIYCQVPNLARGAAPHVDLALLESELRGFLEGLVRGDYMLRHVPVDARRLNDIALSGNGEPTSAPEFEQVVDLVGRVMADFSLTGAVKLVLITNGSLLARAAVQRGLAKMAQLNGEVWFKLDSATVQGRRRINGSRQGPDAALANLRRAAGLCTTWIQTAVFSLNGLPPDETERRAYLDLLARAVALGIPLRGVLLYGLARPSRQLPEGRLTAPSIIWLEALADEIGRLGLRVRLNP